MKREDLGKARTLVDRIRAKEKAIGIIQNGKVSCIDVYTDKHGSIRLDSLPRAARILLLDHLEGELADLEAELKTLGVV